MPEDIRKRSDKNITECFVAEDRQIICLFRDNTVRKVDLLKLATDNRNVVCVLNNDSLLHTVKVGVGGYSISFDGNVEVSSSAVRENGVLLPISASDMFGFVRENIVDTTTVCDMLQCSRQNLSYLANTKKLEPIMQGTKVKLYTKGSVEKTLTD